VEKTILLIESSESERKDISGFLSSIGYTVQLAKNSSEGLRMFNDGQSDLVIVEVLLSGGANGLQVCKSIKDTAPDWAKVIVISKLYNSRAMARDAVNRYKADVYLEKPFQMADLFDHIRNLIGEPPDTEKMQEVLAGDAKPKSRPAGREPKRRKRAAGKSAPIPEPQAPLPPPVEVKPVLEPAPTPQPEPPPEPPVERIPAPIAEPDSGFSEQGEVTAENLGSLLHFCFQKNVSGVLVLDYPEGIKHVFLVDGMPVFVQSNLPEETIGQMLLAGGHLTAVQIHEILADAQAAGQKFGTVCVRKGFLTAANLQAILTEQTAVKVAACFEWEKGQYRIDNARQYPSGAPSFEAPPAKILWIAYKRYVPVERIEQMIQAVADRIVFAGQEPIYQGLARILSDDEKVFVDRADGTLSLAELIESGQLDSEAATRLAGCLLAMGVFKLGDVRRNEDLSEYAPDPAVETNEAQDALAMFSNAVGELSLRLETEHPFAVFEIDPSASKEEARIKLQGLREQFDSGRLPPEASKALIRKVNAVRSKLEGAFSQLDQPAPAKGSSITADQAIERGEKAMARGKYHRAVDFFKRAVELEPENGRSRLLLGEAIFKKLTKPGHTLDDAATEIEQALSLGASSDAAFSLLAEIARNQGDSKSEQAYLDRINQDGPEDGSKDQDPADWDLGDIDPDDPTAE
jgi:CheY-like chemotaxis protein